MALLETEPKRDVLCRFNIRKCEDLKSVTYTKALLPLQANSARASMKSSTIGSWYLQAKSKKVPREFGMLGCKLRFGLSCCPYSLLYKKAHRGKNALLLPLE